ncbi:MAG: hypothetical protein WC243_01745, partial [Patescibacteria group bacterium]
MLLFWKKLMSGKIHKHLFTKYGKEVTSYKDLDLVFTLVEQTEKIDIETVDSIAIESEPTRLARMAKLPRNLFGELRNELSILKQKKIRIIPAVWATSTAALAALVIVMVSTGTTSVHRIKNNKYSIFSSKPLTLSSATARLFGGTTESAALDAVFESYNCPLEGTGK